MTESIITEALEIYAERDETIPGGEETARQLERDIMLQIIDQRWQDHLADMDYLKEGINLRAMGNQDPLVAWQREGFAMFGKLMDNINDDYLRYVFHVQVLDRGAGRRARPGPGQLRGGRGPGPGGRRDLRGVRHRHPGRDRGGRGRGRWARSSAAGGVLPDDAETQAPIVKSDREKIGRNEPCWCGSGKKFKLCHGAN